MNDQELTGMIKTLRDRVAMHELILATLINELDQDKTTSIKKVLFDVHAEREDASSRAMLHFLNMYFEKS